MWVSLASCVDYPGLSPRVQCKHKGPYKWKRGAGDSEWRDMKTQPTLAGFEDVEKERWAKES